MPWCQLPKSVPIQQRRDQCLQPHLQGDCSSASVTPVHTACCHPHSLTLNYDVQRANVLTMKSYYAFIALFAWLHHTAASDEVHDTLKWSVEDFILDQANEGEPPCSYDYGSEWLDRWQGLSGDLCNAPLPDGHDAPSSAARCWAHPATSLAMCAATNLVADSSSMSASSEGSSLRLGCTLADRKGFLRDRLRVRTLER